METNQIFEIERKARSGMQAHVLFVSHIHTKHGHQVERHGQSEPGGVVVLAAKYLRLTIIVVDDIEVKVVCFIFAVGYVHAKPQVQSDRAPYGDDAAHRKLSAV